MQAKQEWAKSVLPTDSQGHNIKSSPQLTLCGGHAQLGPDISDRNVSATLATSRSKKKMFGHLPTMTLKPRGIEGVTNENWEAQSRCSKTAVSATRPEAWVGISTVNDLCELKGSHSLECGLGSDSWLKRKTDTEQRGTSQTKLETLGFSDPA